MNVDQRRLLEVEISFHRCSNSNACILHTVHYSMYSILFAVIVYKIIAVTRFLQQSMLCCISKKT